MYKTVKAAENALNLEQRREREAEAKVRQRQRDAELAAEMAGVVARWPALPASDRKGIKAGVSKRFPMMTPGGKLFMDHCYLALRGLEAAQAEAARWQALSDAERAAIETEARDTWQLWSQTADGLYHACLLIAHQRRRRAEAR